MAKVKIANLGAVGVVKDTVAQDLPPEAFTDVRNIRFNRQGAVAFSGHRSVFSGALEPMYWIKAFPPVTNPVWVYATQNGLWSYNGIHQEITRESAPFAYSEGHRWQGEIFKGMGIFNNGLDLPQVWPGFQASARTFDLPNWPATLRAKWIRPFKDFLIAGWTIEDGADRPFRVRWSSSAAPGEIPMSWALDDPSKDSGEIDLAETPDYLVDGLALGDLFVCYKERTAWALQYTGDQYVFRNFQILHDRGLLWRDCVQAFPGGHFVVGQDDIYIHHGQRGSERSIVHDKMRKWVYNQLSGSTYYNCFTMQNKEQKELWFCFPEAKETYATLALVWNWDTGGIGIRDLPGVPYMYPGVVLEEGELDIWGGSDITAVGWLESGLAEVAAGVENVKITVGALEGQAAQMTGQGQPVQPGWPEFGNDPNFRYFGNVTESGGPIRLSEIPLTNLGGQPIPVGNISGKVTLTFSPGVVRTGDFYGTGRQSALFLDKLNDNSVIILNLEGATLRGGTGVDESSFPAITSPVPFYLKVNGGTVEGGPAPGGNLTQGYWLVKPPGGEVLVQGATVSGGTQNSGSLQAHLSLNGLTSVVENGTVVLGEIEVFIGGAASDKTPQLLITRQSGDSAVVAAWVKDTVDPPPGGNLKILVTSTGTNRRRDAVFYVYVRDAAHREVFAGPLNVVATHGTADFSLTLDPTGVNQFVQLPAKDNAVGSLEQIFNAQLIGGTGPFAYNWTTNVGEITNGQGTAQAQLTVTSGFLSRGSSQVMQGTLTCTLTDQGNNGDQLIRTAPIYVLFDNSLPQQEHVGTGPLSAQAAVVYGEGIAELDESVGGGYLASQRGTTNASGTVIPVIPLVVSVAPPSVSETITGPGNTQYSHQFNVNLTASIANGVGPFTYSWGGKTGWTVLNDGTAAPTFRRTLTAPADGYSSYSGTLSCTVTDQTTLHEHTASVPVFLELRNYRVAQIIFVSSVSLQAQAAGLAATVTVTSPAQMSVSVLPGSIYEHIDGASSWTWDTPLTATVTGGVGPFSYNWTSTVGSFITANGLNTRTHRAMLNAGPGQWQSITGTITCTVTDQGRAGNPTTSTQVFCQFSLSNGGLEP